MDQFLSGFDISTISLILALCMLGSWQIGRLMGLRLHAKGYDEPSKFDDAGMAFVGLLVAFAFGMAIETYNQRRTIAVSHSSAIGDFYFSAAMLKEPTRTELQTIIRQYGQLILDLSKGRRRDIDIEDALARSEQMRKQMADLVRQAVDDGSPIAELLNTELNALTDNEALRLAAFRQRVPANILILLCVSSIIATFLIGREQAITSVQEFTGTICFVLLISIAVYVTLDLNSPNQGLIHISQESLERLMNSMSR